MHQQIAKNAEQGHTMTHFSLRPASIQAKHGSHLMINLPTNTSRPRPRLPTSPLRWGVDWIIYLFSPHLEAHSRLYRRQMLQVNIRWKVLDEIYKMYILLHRSDLKFQQKRCHNFGKIKNLNEDSIHSNAILKWQPLLYSINSLKQIFYSNLNHKHQICDRSHIYTLAI